MDGMNSSSGPGELGAFLRARRAQLSPREAGLPETGARRKVAGLRREEVAQLAVISVDYYTRLEQGRVRASASALALYTDFGRVAPGRRNYVRLLFTDAVVRGMHLEWEHDARDAVAALRMEAAKDPDDPELARLVGELSVQDPDFGTWWAEHHVNSASYGTKHYRHRTVGDLTLDCDTWASPDGSGQRLMVLTAEPGTPSHDALCILTAWTAEEAGQPSQAPQRDPNR